MDEINISLRVVGLNKIKYEYLCQKVPNFDIDPYIKNNLYIFTCTLDINSCYKKINSALDDLKLDRKNVDIFISFVSEYDTRIIDIPKWCTNLVYLLDIELTFSYTLV